MRVLLTNWRLQTRAGSELYLGDVARWLRDHGHVPVAYAPLLGAVADDLHADGIAVIDDLRLMAEPPDVIHGQHHLSTMTAIATFPGVPAIGFCHGWAPWEEMPIPHPAVRRYVTVSRHTRDRAVLESGIDPKLVHILPNFVDLHRFRSRGSVPERPRRALVFSNYAAPQSAWVNAVVAACASRDLPLEVVGARWGNDTNRPEEKLLEADLVFAKARAAMEAMATGAGVILCDESGIGPFVTPTNFDELRDGNFGMAVLRPPHDAALLAAAIDQYNPEATAAVSERVQNELGRDAIVGRLVALYNEAIAESRLIPIDEHAAAEAIARYLYQLNRLDPVPRNELYRVQSDCAHERANLEQAHQRAMAAQSSELEVISEAQRGIAGIRAQLETMADEQRANTEQRAALATSSEVRSLVDALRPPLEALSEAQHENASLRAELETMRSSTSWQVTAPLRRAGASARKVASHWRN